MDENARKYCINTGEIKSHGISACTIADQYNLLNAFCVDGCNYSQITTDELSQLTKPDYLKRVCDFLTYLNIEESRIRDDLLENASVCDPECNVICKLNSDFLVYRFLEGVRVVNIGEVTGEAQYRAYPIEDDSSGYTWQTSATFLNLDLSKVYVFEVRDYSEGEELCKVQRTISLSTLVQSTTFVPEEKLVYINQKSCNTSGYLYFNNGTINVDPSLTDNEIVCVNYTLFADAYFDAQSCAQLYCKSKNSSTYTNYCCLTDFGGSTNNTFTLCAGDSMCYNLSVIVPSPGSCGCSCFEINSVGGGGTTLPSIDQSRSCVTRSASIPRENISVSIDETIPYENEYYQKKTGNFNFSPAIPEDNCMTLELTGLSERSSTASNNKATIVIKCRPDGGSAYDDIITHSHNSSQPLVDCVTAKHGDDLCYEIEVEATADQISTSCFSITDTSGSNGILSSIGSPSGVCAERDVPPEPVTVSMCKQNTICNDGCSCGCGYINVDPSLSNDEYVKFCFDALLYVSSEGSPTTADQARAAILCKGENDFTHVNKCFMIQQTDGCQLINGVFYARPNDSICYCVLTYNPFVTYAVSCLTLTNATGYNGISASINPSKCDHCVDSITDIYGYPTMNSPIGENNL